MKSSLWCFRRPRYFWPRAALHVDLFPCSCNFSLPSKKETRTARTGPISHTSIYVCLVWVVITRLLEAPHCYFKQKYMEAKVIRWGSTTTREASCPNSCCCKILGTMSTAIFLSFRWRKRPKSTNSIIIIIIHVNRNSVYTMQLFSEESKTL